MNAACTPNGTATRFVPGSGIILQSSVLPPTFARRGRQGFAAGFRQAAPHSAAPPCVLIPSIRLYGSARPTVRAMAALIFPPQASNEKTPPRGATARRGVVSQRRKRGSASTRPTWEDAFIKGSGCRFDSRLWNPEIIDCALPAPVSPSDNLVAFIRCPFYPESGQIADISGGLLCAKSGHWPDYAITSSARVRNEFANGRRDPSSD